MEATELHLGRVRIDELEERLKFRRRLRSDLLEQLAQNRRDIEKAKEELRDAYDRERREFAKSVVMRGAR